MGQLVVRKNIAKTISPIDIILDNSVFQEEYMKLPFRQALESLWQCAVFKYLLDLAATKCFDKLLHFKIADKKFFELDNGNCKTIFGTWDKMLNTFRKEKHFQISIKKIAADIIIHEVAHMVQNALSIELRGEFMQIMHYEIANQSIPGLKQAAKQLFIEELKEYPAEDKESEFFARIYQLVALTKEIKGFSESFAISLDQIERSFSQTLTWLQDNVDNIISHHINPEIAASSASYVKPLSQLKHTWAGQRIQSFHKTKSSNNKPKWSKSVKPLSEKY